MSSSRSCKRKFPINYLTENFQSFWKKCFLFIFPPSRAEYIIELSSNKSLLNTYKDFKSQIKYFTLYFFCILIISAAFQLPFLESLQPIRPKSFGQIGKFVFIGQAFGCIEVLVIRIWLYYLIYNKKDPLKIEFVQLITLLDKKKNDIILKRANMVIVNTTLTAYIFHTLELFLIINDAESISRIILSTIHTLGYFQLVRIGITDGPILYTFAVAGFSVVHDQVLTLRQMVNHCGILYPIHQVIEKYFVTINSVRKLNSLTGSLLMTSNLLVIPIASVVIISFLIPINGWTMRIAKHAILGTGFIYSVRGYVLIALLSKIETSVKKLQYSINSIIARRSFNDPIRLKVLKVILEDITSERSRISVREIGSKVDQMDFYNSIVSTLSIVTLLFTLRNSMNNF